MRAISRRRRSKHKLQGAKAEGASKDLPLREKYQEEDDQSTNYKKQEQLVRVRICPYESNIKKKMIKAQTTRNKAQITRTKRNGAGKELPI